MAYSNTNTIPLTSIVLSRQGKLIFVVCIISLIALWSCRLPRLCLFDKCPSCPAYNQGQTPLAGPPVSSVDLSLPDAPFVSWPLARVCNEITAWTPGLVFLCDNNSGGIGNIRNFILTCLRYAIEAGATAITLPVIQTRAEDDLSQLFIGKKLPFSYFFDEEHFRSSLGIACPRITIYDGLAEVPGLDEEDLRAGKINPDMITPNHFGMRGGCDQRDLNRHSDLFGTRFQASMAEKQELLHLGPVSAANPKLVKLTWGVQWNWPVYKDGPEFVNTFGGLLRFRHDILGLGMKTVDAMRKFAAAHAQRSGKSSFIGMHLRTESDALSGWPTYEDQASGYLARAASITPAPSAAYLATGNATEAAKLASRALSESRLHVITKNDLLRAYGSVEELEQLDALTWDQQALVDFVVLLRCEYFMGVSPSSFSMNVASKRHVKMEGIYARPWKIGNKSGDGRSWLVGKYAKYWEDWLFMYDSLWP